MKIMVAYDGTLQAKEALAYGIDKAREKGGEVVALHVLNTGLFVDYDAHLDAETMARVESARFLEEAKSLIREKADGVKASLYSTEGNPAEEVVSFAKDNKIDILLCPPKFKTIIKKYKKAMGAASVRAGVADFGLAVLSPKNL